VIGEYVALAKKAWARPLADSISVYTPTAIRCQHPAGCHHTGINGTFHFTTSEYSSSLSSMTAFFAQILYRNGITGTDQRFAEFL